MIDRMKNLLLAINNQVSSKKKTMEEPDKKPNNIDDDFPNPIDEDIMEGKCLCEDTVSDDDSESYSMAISLLKNMSVNILSILNNIEMQRVKENLTEPWVLGILAVADDNISTVHDFSRFEGEDDEDSSDAAKKPGLWENIRRKKERMGRNYKPAKPGDKDRPDSEQWKKLTK